MLSASNITSPEIASIVRQGEKVESVLYNTTNIKELDQLTSEVHQAMQLGANASDKADKMKAQTQPVQLSEEDLPGYAPGTVRDKDGNLIFKS